MTINELCDGVVAAMNRLAFEAPTVTFELPRGEAMELCFRITKDFHELSGHHVNIGMGEVFTFKGVKFRIIERSVR